MTTNPLLSMRVRSLMQKHIGEDPYGGCGNGYGGALVGGAPVGGARGESQWQKFLSSNEVKKCYNDFLKKKKKTRVSKLPKNTKGLYKLCMKKMTNDPYNLVYADARKSCRGVRKRKTASGKNYTAATLRNKKILDMLYNS